MIIRSAIFHHLARFRHQKIARFLAKQRQQSSPRPFDRTRIEFFRRKQIEAPRLAHPFPQESSANSRHPTGRNSPITRPLAHHRIFAATRYIPVCRSSVSRSGRCDSSSPRPGANTASRAGIKIIQRQRRASLNRARAIASHAANSAPFSAADNFPRHRSARFPSQPPRPAWPSKSVARDIIAMTKREFSVRRSRDESPICPIFASIGRLASSRLRSLKRVAHHQSDPLEHFAIFLRERFRLFAVGRRSRRPRAPTG